MIKPIMRDVFFLQQKSEPSTQADKAVAKDLMDTLLAHKQECVGMAANMIGVKKRQKFSGWTAQIIQHECDHLQGIII